MGLFVDWAPRKTHEMLKRTPCSGCVFFVARLQKDGTRVQNISKLRALLSFALRSRVFFVAFFFGLLGLRGQAWRRRGLWRSYSLGRSEGATGRGGVLQALEAREGLEGVVGTIWCTSLSLGPSFPNATGPCFGRVQSRPQVFLGHGIRTSNVMP